MGRSISIPSNAREIIYLDLSEDLCTDDEIQAQENFECLTDHVRSIVRERYKSFTACDEWLGREDHAVLDNCHAFVTISEYCGLVAVCLVERESDRCYETGESNLHGAWCAQVADNFRRCVTDSYGKCALTKMGTFSNGESVYQRL